MSHQEKLNPQQLEAVHHLEGPLLVLAGAGSGKTRVVTSRIVYLLEQGVRPWQILGLTFTNKAANEMKDRVKMMTNHHVLITTFHSLGARILRESISTLGYLSDFAIYDEEDSEKLLKACIGDLTMEKKSDFKILRNLISKAKNDFLPPSESDKLDIPDSLIPLFTQIYATYQARLKECNAVDFDDLLYLPVKLFQEYPEILEMYQNRWSYFLIDEYQDTNAAQYLMVKLLADRTRNLCVVGDPDQSIYSWRGASIHNILNFEKDYPGCHVVNLEQNYRSHGNILKVANALIENNGNRYHKHLWSSLGEGERVKQYTAEDERDEAEFVISRVKKHHADEGIPFNDMVVFYRTNAQSRVFEDILLYHRLPYAIVGGISFYQRREIKDVLAFLRMVATGTDFVAFARTLNLPRRGIGDATLEKIRLGAVQEGLAVFDYAKAIAAGKASLKLSAKQKEGLADYTTMIDNLREVAKTKSLSDVVKAAIYNTPYLEVLQEDPETYGDRKENLDELISKAAEWETETEKPTLVAFLEELSLKSSLDEADHSTDRLKLMTLHNGKGLEFRVTFLVGLEEDLLPHINSKEDPQALEEERRLCYVGVTRAKDYLYLSHARARLMWGMLRNPQSSRFLREIPQDLREKVQRQSLSRWSF